MVSFIYEIALNRYLLVRSSCIEFAMILRNCRSIGGYIFTLEQHSNIFQMRVVQGNHSVSPVLNMNRIYVAHGVQYLFNR